MKQNDPKNDDPVSKFIKEIMTTISEGELSDWTYDETGGAAFEKGQISMRDRVILLLQQEYLKRL